MLKEVVGAPSPCQARYGVRDVRGDAGQIVLPPSWHEYGRQYTWEVTSRPESTPLAPCPWWLLEASKVSKATPVPAAGEPIFEGQRAATLASLAGTMRRRGFGQEAIEAALQAENAARCVPPLPEAEVRRIAASIAQYAPAPPSASKAKKGHRHTSIPDLEVTV